MDITIRQARAKDAKSMLELSRIVGAETDNLGYGSEGMRHNEERLGELCEEIYRSKDSVMLLAEQDGELVGLADFGARRSSREKHRGCMGIAVKKSMWNRGIGTELMKALLASAKEAGIEIMELQVRCDNVNAIHLYEKMGFEKIGIFKGYYKINGKNVDFVLMNLYLDD